MNYGRKKASQKQKKITSKSTMQGKRVGVRLFKAFLLCLVVIAVAGAVGAGVFAKRIIDNAPEVTPESVKPQGYATSVYADDGTTQIQERSTKFPRTCSMLSLRSRMSVFMTTTVSTFRESPVRLLSALLPETSPKAPVR